MLASTFFAVLSGTLPIRVDADRLLRQLAGADREGLRHVEQHGVDPVLRPVLDLLLLPRSPRVDQLARLPDRGSEISRRPDARSCRAACCPALPAERHIDGRQRARVLSPSRSRSSLSSRRARTSVCANALAERGCPSRMLISPRMAPAST